MEKAELLYIFYTYEHLKYHAQWVPEKKLTSDPVPTHSYIRLS